MNVDRLDGHLQHRNFSGFMESFSHSVLYIGFISNDEDYEDEVDLSQYHVVIHILAWNSCSHRPAAQPEDHAKVGAVHCSRRREPTDGSGRVVTCSVAPVAPCSARLLSAAPRLHHREFPELSARGATAAAALPRNSTAHYTAQTPRSEQGKQTAHLAVYSDLS